MTPASSAKPPQALANLAALYGWVRKHLATHGGEAPPTTHGNDTSPAAEPAAKPPAAAPQVASEDPWKNAEAAEQTQKTAKWIIATLAVVSGVVFGAGPIITRPTLSWSAHPLQLGIAWLSGAIGLLGMIALIMLVSRVLQPERVTLSTLPPGLEGSINANRAIFLPSDAEDLQQFRTKYHEWKRTLSATDANLRGAQQQLADARALRDGRAIRDAEHEVADLTDNLDAIRRTVDLYGERAEGILDEARFESVRSRLADRRGRIALAAVAAAVGGLTFQLALASDPSPAGNNSTPHTEAVGYIPPPALNSRIQQTLWANLALNLCQQPDGRVPVLVDSGDGSTSHPWHVTTIATTSHDRCRSQTFTLTQDVIRLYIPEPNTVVVLPASPGPAQPSAAASPRATPLPTSAATPSS